MPNHGTWSFSADGNGTGVTVNHTQPLEVVAYGSTFGGGTVTAQFSPNGGTTWITLKDLLGSNVSLTANDAKGPIKLTPGDMFRPVLSGSSSPSITVELRTVI